MKGCAEMTTYLVNNEHNGIEIYFSRKPDQCVIESLKAARWRWHNLKKCWYNRNDNVNLEFAQNIAS